jgi:DNA-binding CsgD family transcriptional regulator
MMALNARHGLAAGYTISFPMAIKNANAGIGLVAKRGMTQDDADAIWAEHGEIIQIINHVAHLCILQLPAAGQRRLLTARQTEVLELVADGKTMQDIAMLLERNVATVEKHLRGARDALGRGDDGAGRAQGVCPEPDLPPRPHRGHRCAPPTSGRGRLGQPLDRLDPGKVRDSALTNPRE